MTISQLKQLNKLGIIEATIVFVRSNEFHKNNLQHFTQRSYMVISVLQLVDGHHMFRSLNLCQTFPLLLSSKTRVNLRVSGLFLSGESRPRYDYRMTKRNPCIKREKRRNVKYSSSALLCLYFKRATINCLFKYFIQPLDINLIMIKKR